MGPLTVCSVVSAEICAMTRRAAELAEETMRQEGLGGPPVPYAVLVLGSAGRGESQLAADQDNAIVYAQGAEGGPEDTYFEQLATRMNETLDTAGVPFCKGGVMAKNRAWRKSVADWHATIDKWMTGSRPDHLLNVDIFFDAVPVHGEAALADVGLEPRLRPRTCGHRLPEPADRERAPARQSLHHVRPLQDGREGPHRPQEVRPDADLHRRPRALHPPRRARPLLRRPPPGRGRQGGCLGRHRRSPSSTPSARCWPPCWRSSWSTPKSACRCPRASSRPASTSRTRHGSRRRSTPSMPPWSLCRRGGCRHG